MTSTVLPLLATVLAVVLPGLLVSLVTRVPFFLAVTTAPVVTFGLVALSTQVVGAIGVPWTTWSFTVVTVVIALAAGAVARWIGPRRDGGWWPGRVGDPGTSTVWRTRPDVVVLVVVALAGLLSVAVMVRGMGGLEGINQEFDVLFHVNAIALISETHNADPATIGAVNHYSAGATSYPIAFHALGALVADLGFPAVVAANSLVAVVPTVLVAGLSGLCWQAGLRRHALAVPFVAISIAAFPVDLLWRGPLWPFAMGVALIPGFMALLWRAFESRSVSAALATSLGAAGLLSVHPSAALSAGVFAAAWFVQRWFGHRAAVKTDVVPLAGVAVLALVFALPAVTTALANSGYGAAYDWPAVQTAGWAIGELLTFNYFAPAPQVWLVVLLVAGALTLRRVGRLAWLFVVTGLFALLMVMAAAYEGPLVALLTGPWWNDRFRFVALATVGLAVACAHGVVTLAELLVRGVQRVASHRRRAVRTPSWASMAAVVAVLLVFGVVSQGWYAGYNVSRLGLKFDMGTGGSVTQDDLDALAYLDGVTEPGEVVMNDPGDGSAWMWALYGIRPMFGQAVLDPPVPALEADQDLALYDFNCLASDPEVRDVVQRYDIRYVFVSQSFIFPQMYRSEGMRSLFASPDLRLVYANQGAQVYEVQLGELVPAAEDNACIIGDRLSADYRPDSTFGSLTD